MKQTYYVYILTNWDNSLLYIGVTNDLTRRLYEHQNKNVKGFTEKYYISKLVYFEQADNVESAILREKQLKKWRRDKKDFLIQTMNPEWINLFQEMQKEDPSASLGMTG